MPRKQFASWDGAPAYRWKKMIRGVTYRITCDDLRTPRDKEGSRAAAQAYFEKLQLELAIQAKAPQVQAAIDDINAKIAYAETTNAAFLENLEKVKADVLAVEPHLHLIPSSSYDVSTHRNPPVPFPQAHLPHDDDEVISRNMEFARKNGIEVNWGTAPPEILREFFGDSRLWDERRRNLKKTATDFTLEYQAEQFLALNMARGKKARTHGELARHVRGTVIKMAPLSPKMDVRQISGKTVEQFFISMSKQPIEASSKKKYWGFFKRLVRYLASNELIHYPANLNERIFRFGYHAKRIKEYSIAEVCACLDSLKPRCRLYAMLALNCGMLSVDMASILKTDIRDGYITRKRVKTESHQDVPIVTYKLWQATLDAIAAWPNDSKYLLVNSKGEPMHKSVLNANGKELRKNNIRQQWKDAKIKIPLRAFRSIGAAMIRQAFKNGGKREYGEHYTYYLGHAPRDMGTAHYAPPDDVFFAEIIEWLGSKFNIK